MGRPRLYNTEEEKRAANCRKSKKHYEVNKTTINRRRRQQAKRERGCTSRVNQDAGKEAQGSVRAGDAPKPSQLEIVMDRVENVSIRFTKALCGKSVPDFLTHVFLGFEARYKTSIADSTSTVAKDYIMEEELVFSRLTKSLAKYRGMILNIAGVGKEWRRAEEVEERINEVIRGLDNLLCDAMVDPQELVERFYAQKLEFQA